MTSGVSVPIGVASSQAPVLIVQRMMAVLTFSV